ncbi:MAG: hypothetical protein ABR886_07220 [Dehalococcoidales bacterium]
MGKITFPDLCFFVLCCLAGAAVCYFGYVWVFILAGLLFNFIYLITRAKRKPAT